MNHSDIAALMKGAAPAIRDFVAAAMQPLVARIAELERELDALRSIDVAGQARAAAQEAVAALPPPRESDPGPEGPAGRDGVDGAPGRDGTDGRDGVDGAQGVPGERGPEGPAGRDGIDGIDGVPGRDGTDGRDGLDGAQGVPGERGPEGPAGRDGVDGPPGRDGADGRDGLPGERGPEGPPGKLSVAQAWQDGVSYEGAVRTHGGALWQAVRDTGRAPPHEDWCCLAVRGADGADGRSITVRGTWSADGDYSPLDIVALNGSTFVAKTDRPGQCPGPGWQLLASRGKTGAPGERGAKGEKGERGPAGVVVALEVDDQGLLSIRNGDGSVVTCDLYPLLSKLGAS